jgi:anthranilate synthase / indole-3-glycerol phosphate synthase / phosphoribosylanthranilate isomerase
MTRIKICGCMRPEDAVAAATAGADMVGMIFVEGARRCVSVDDAAFIVAAVRDSLPKASNPFSEPSPPRSQVGGESWFERWADEISRRIAIRRPLVVGVFANQSVDYINEVVESCDLDLVQFSGEERSELALGVIRPVLKSVKVSDGSSAKSVLSDISSETIALPLLEPQVAGAHGGTGTIMDWSVAREVAVTMPVILAGGLNPENVADAVAKVRPWGVDVSSGVETAGTKDPTKINAFITAVRGA